MRKGLKKWSLIGLICILLVSLITYIFNIEANHEPLSLLLNENVPDTFPYINIESTLENASSVPMGTTKLVAEQDNAKTNKRKIQFVYERKKKDYDQWNLWTWQTGMTEGQKNFQEITEQGAITTFEIGKNTSAVGFVLRKGTDWALKDSYEQDRYIPTDLSQILTKVFVYEGEEKVRLIPSVKGPKIEDGHVT